MRTYKRNTKSNHISKKTYVYLGLVTMAALSLLAKPIKRGFSALEKHLANASCEEKKSILRRNLNLWSGRGHNGMTNAHKDIWKQSHS